MKEFFRQLFCHHKFKYTKINKLVHNVKTNEVYYETTEECLNCGKIKIGEIHIND